MDFAPACFDCGPADMHLSSDPRRVQLGEDPLSGHLFLFTNKTHTRLKVLVWDGSALWVCAKRLERGRFRWPKPETETTRHVVMRSEELAMLLNGLDLTQTRKHKNWLRRTPSAA